MFSCLKIDLTEKVLEKRTYEHLFNEYFNRCYCRNALLGNWMAIVSFSTWFYIFNSRFNRDLAVYVQHTFEDSYFEEDKEWEYVKAAVEGSSFYKLPKILQFLTGNIGFHHVHHLSPRVPNYKLEEAHNNTLPLKMYQQLRLLQACVHSVSVFGMRKVTILLALKMSKI